jgi:DNA-binding NarL/FixJ family response regulator
MITIGIVEDNRTTREALATIVEHSPGFSCVSLCETAEEALERLPKCKPDVVLMDIQLPRMSGVDCVAQLKKSLPEVQVIMVTVYEDPDRIFAALRNGASGYLLKRSAPEQVIAAIREVQSGGAPMSTEVARKVIQHFHEQSAVAEEVETLTAREREVLELLAGGFVNKEIAERTGVSVDTVRYYLKRIYVKLHVRTRTEAALKFHRPTS